jgi:dTDP-4-amino-4,6-dideoxy-D-galactose acyltransferase
MIASVPAKSSDVLRSLAWDSAHFGLRVGQIAQGGLSSAALSGVLREARSEGFELLYYTTTPDRDVFPAILEQYGGIEVGDRIEFEADLNCEQRVERSDANEVVLLNEYPCGSACGSLLELGVAAGGHSRFFRDPHLPAAQSRKLFELWTHKSTKRRLADVVLTAILPGRAAKVGMVTVAGGKSSGRIGLVAVRQDARCRGVGTELISAAKQWMFNRGMTNAVVVTQRANHPARRLYRRCGFRQRRVERMYHFWPFLPGRAGPEVKT